MTKVYGEGATEVCAVDDMDLSVDRGSLVAVMGPSGSGKSTLLTIAGTLESPTSGDVLIDGAAVSGMSRGDQARLRRRTIGYVFQDFNLLAGLTAAENVSLPLELDGLGARKARESVEQVLTELGLGERSGHYPDEPSGELDSQNGEAVMRLILAACKRGAAAVVVTHDAQLASWADRVVFIRDGRIVDRTVPPPSPEALLDHAPEPSPQR